jgi:Abortive infection alpha
MSLPDTVTTGLVVGTTLGVAKQAQDFIAAVSGHKGESIGTILGTIVERQRHNAETVFCKSHLILLNIGVKAGEIPLNVLKPLLEGASLQEDPTLQETWANLVANAADPRKVNEVSPSFANVLKELTWREVKFLDRINQEMEQPSAGSFPGHFGFSEPRLMMFYKKACGESSEPRHFSFSIDLLTRNLVLKLESTIQPIKIAEKLLRAAKGSYTPPTLDVETRETYKLTDFGVAFIKACQPPKETVDQTNGSE